MKREAGICVGKKRPSVGKESIVSRRVRRETQAEQDGRSSVPASVEETKRDESEE